MTELEVDAEPVHGVTFLLVRDGCVLLERCPKKRIVLGVAVPRRNVGTLVLGCYLVAEALVRAPRIGRP